MRIIAVSPVEEKRTMTHVVSIGTYLPPWTVRERRVKGPDEDALTMAVAAGRAADPDATAARVGLVSRDFPLLEGGNGAVLLAALTAGRHPGRRSARWRARSTRPTGGRFAGHA